MKMESGNVYRVAGKNLRLWRVRLGLTQQDLAEKAGISVAFLSFLETGRKKGSLETYDRLARALDVDLGAILAETGPDRRTRGNAPPPGYSLQIRNLSVAERGVLRGLVRMLRGRRRKP